MQFRILGPLEVLRDGSPVPIRGRHQPRILAMLLLEAGRTVTVSRLSEVLWEGEPPDTAWRQVRNYVAALRRTLSAGAIDPIEGVAQGFRFTVDGNEVDALRFDNLVVQARVDMRAGRDAQALERFNEALGLWRGPALAGLSSTALISAATSLSDARLAAIEDRAEARLNLGQNEAAVPELRDLLAGNPFRQRAAGRLMLALYRCGRTPEALDAFTELNDGLNTQLGIDPSGHLRELHDKILRGDPSLSAPVPASPADESTSKVPVPAQLPASVTTFTGRAEQLAELDMIKDSAAGVAVAAISGGGGIGKSALAVHWGQNHRDSFPDGQLYINLRGFDHSEPLHPLEVLSRFMRSLGVAGPNIPVGLDEATAMFRSLLDGRRILIVLDNARTADQVRPVLPGSSGSMVVVTSRNRLASLVAFDDAIPVGLETLSPAESLELLADMLGAKRLHAEPRAAHRLAELCGHLPLAIRIAAANLAARPSTEVDAFVSELDSTARLELLEIDGDPHSAVAATFELSYRALEPDAKSLFERLGMIPGEDIPQGLMVATTGLSESQVLRVAHSLVSANLLESHVEGRYRFHDLVKIFARRRAENTLDEQTRSSVTDQIIEWCYDNHRSFTADDMPNVIAICRAVDGHPRVWRAAIGLFIAAELGIGHEIVRELCGTALRVAEANDDMLGQARMLSVLANMHYMTGEPETAVALSRRAVAIAQDNADQSAYSALCNNLGLRLYWNGEYREAETWLTKALRLLDPPDNPATLQIRLHNLGSVHRVLGRFDEAADQLKRATQLSIDNGTYLDEVSINVGMAMLLNDQGQYTKARALGDQAFETAKTKPSFRHIVLVLQQRGRAEWGCGNINRAREYFHTAAVYASRSGSFTMERQSLCHIAELESDDGDQSRAIDYLELIGRVDVAQPTRVQTAELLRVESKVRSRTSEYRRAVELGCRAVALFAEMPSPLRHARSLAALADAYEGLKDTAKARDSRAEALAIFTRLGVPDAARLRDEIDARRASTRW